MFIRTRGLVLLALALMTLLVAIGGGSIYADIREEQTHIQACDELVSTLTPDGCIHAFVRGYIEEDEILLRALHADKTMEFTFDHAQDEQYPVAVVWPPADRDASMVDSQGAHGNVVYLAILEFEDAEGNRAEYEYTFEFARAADGRWQIVNRGYGGLS